MDKKTILGIVVVAALFLGFAYFNTKQQEKYQQEKYQQEMAAYQAYQDSVAAATRPVVPVADSTAVAASSAVVPEAEANAADAVRRQQVAALGEYLAGARDAEAEEFTVENDVMIVTFSTRGGRITGVTLKDYTKYAPRGKRDQLIELMDPASARFDLSFYVKNGLNNVKVNTMDYVFRAQPEQVEGDARRVVMRLPVAADAWLEYEYLIYNKQVPERDYLVDFNVRLVNMAPQMANQTRSVSTGRTPFLPERKGIPEREHVHDDLVPVPGRELDRGSGDERKIQVEEHLDVGQLGGFQAAVLLVGVHRPGKLLQRQPGVRYGGSRLGIAEEFFGADGRALYGADRRV